MKVQVEGEGRRRRARRLPLLALPRARAHSRVRSSRPRRPAHPAPDRRVRHHRRRAPEVDLEGAWRRAVDDIVKVHNERADPRSAQRSVGAAQQWALELLRDPTVILPAGADAAADALAVERSSTVRRALNEIRADAHEERITRNSAAESVVALVERLGLRRIELAELPEVIEEGDVAVVCWMAVLPPA